MRTTRSRTAWAGAAGLLATCTPAVVNPTETRADFSDQARMTTEMTVEDPPDAPPMIVANPYDGGGIVVVQGAKSRRLTSRWAGSVVEAPEPLAAVGFCRDYVGTSGATWYRFQLSRWTPITDTLPFQVTTMIAGGGMCLATDGTEWKSSTDARTWSPVTLPSGVLALGTDRDQALAVTSTQVWVSTDAARTWRPFTGFPAPSTGRVLLAGVYFAYIDGVWYRNTSTPWSLEGPWEADAFLRDNAPADPVAIGSDGPGRLLVTDGIRWWSLYPDEGYVTDLPSPWQ